MNTLSKAEEVQQTLTEQLQTKEDERAVLTEKLERNEDERVALESVVKERDERITLLEHQLKERDERITLLEHQLQVVKDSEQRLKEKVDRERAQNRELAAAKSDSEGQFAVLQKRIKEQQDELGAMSCEVHDLRQQLRIREGQVEDLEQLASSRNEDVEHLKEELQQRMQELAEQCALVSSLQITLEEREVEFEMVQQDLCAAQENIVELAGTASEQQHLATPVSVVDRSVHEALQLAYENMEKYYLRVNSQHQSVQETIHVLEARDAEMVACVEQFEAKASECVDLQRRLKRGGGGGGGSEEEEVEVLRQRVQELEESQFKEQQDELGEGQVERRKEELLHDLRQKSDSTCFSEQVLRWGKRRLTNYCDEQYSPSLAKEQKYTCGQNFQLVVDDLEIKFTPEAQIGEGSFGDVWKGTRSGSPCAVKMLHGMKYFFPIHSNIRSEKHKKLVRECELLQNLRHPNVVAYLQTYIHPETGAPLLAMELMDENLSTFLEHRRETSGKRLSECVVVKICSDVAEALKYLHAEHIVHRDLSSNNILLSGSTQTVNCQSICAKVSDFGISTRIPSGSDETLSTIAPGDQRYMPPESWKHGKFDEKFDIFSFGVLMVQIITMLPPDPHGDRVDSSNRIVPEVERREDHLKLIKGHPLEDFVLPCLQDGATVRPTASESCQKLQQLQQLTIQCRC